MFLTPVLVSVSLLGLVNAVPVAEKAGACAVVFEGRIPQSRNLADLDSSKTNPFRTDSSLGEGQKWSRVISYPAVEGSQYDIWANSKPIEVTINDQSIYNPSPSRKQSGLRRAELQPGTTNGDNKALMTGKKTLHFSLQFDSRKPLNYSHEYQLFFMETADWNYNQLVLRTGSILGGSKDQQSNPQVLRLFGNSKQNKVLFESGFVSGWHNFALELDFDKNTILTHYSHGVAELKPTTSAPVPNDLTGFGEYHFGILKKPTGTNDILFSGFQESKIDEGVIFSGVFIENGALDCSKSAGVGRRQDPGSIQGVGSTTIGFFPAFHEPNRPVNWNKGPMRDDCGPSRSRWRGSQNSGTTIIWSKKREAKEALAYAEFNKRNAVLEAPAKEI